jgi:oligopeptide transport system substrate-binding protein
MSYGPYRLESLQEGKQIVFVQNENWYGYEKQDDGSLLAITPYEVDGEHIQRWQATSVVIDVMDDAAAKQAFLKGELSDWTPTADDLVTYSTSDQLYKVDETYTQSFFFNCGLENLKVMDESKGNQNSVVLSNVNFRKAMSLAIDRQEYVSATAGFKPAYSLLNSLYYYDVYNDPTSSYRNSEEAMTAIVNLYGVEYGEGTPYATLKDAYQSINGYNLTEAQLLFKQACEELVAEGLYTAGDPIHIRIGFKKGALDSSDNKVVEIINKQLNAALEGSGFGKLELEAIGNINDRYGDTAKGEYAIGYGAWGGAAFYPFRNFQVYCDPDQYSIHEAGCWDPKSETLTLKVNGEDVTMTWQAWSQSMVGTGVYTDADFATKLSILSQMEEQYLKKYYRIPLAGTTACSMLSYQVNYYTENYNIMYGFGGLELMSYNYSDAEWSQFIADEGGVLSYE